MLRGMLRRWSEFQFLVERCAGVAQAAQVAQIPIFVFQFVRFLLFDVDVVVLVCREPTNLYMRQKQQHLHTRSTFSLYRHMNTGQPAQQANSR